MVKIGLLVVFILMGIILFFLENRRCHRSLSLRHYEIESNKIPKEFHNKKIAFLSDLHNNQFGKDNERILHLLEQEKPDYVFVGGDMLVSKIGDEYETALTLLKKLAKKYPVYCGNGNHEARLLWKSEEWPGAGAIYEEYTAAMKNAGVIHMCNETTKIMLEKEWIYLSEIDLSKNYYKKFSYEHLDTSHMEQLIGKRQEDSFHILLAHNPTYFESYAAWGADLTLCGHLHGGIVRLPFLGGVIDPALHLFPKYDAGLFQLEDKKMIVSVGLGTHSIKVRLFNPPKIDMITLKSC